MMQEMRIVPELPRYQELLQTLFFEMMDGKLQTPEEMKAFLEPYSPPAPPPPVHLRRPRAVKKIESKRPRKKAAEKAVAEVEKIRPEGSPDAALDAGSPTTEVKSDGKSPRAVPVKANEAGVAAAGSKAPPSPNDTSKVTTKPAPVPAKGSPTATLPIRPATLSRVEAKAEKSSSAVVSKRAAKTKQKGNAVSQKAPAVRAVAKSGGKPAATKVPTGKSAARTGGKSAAAKPTKKSTAGATSSAAKKAAKPAIKKTAKPVIKKAARRATKKAARPAAKKVAKSATKAAKSASIQLRTTAKPKSGPAKAATRNSSALKAVAKKAVAKSGPESSARPAAKTAAKNPAKKKNR